MGDWLDKWRSERARHLFTRVHAAHIVLCGSRKRRIKLELIERRALEVRRQPRVHRVVRPLSTRRANLANNAGEVSSFLSRARQPLHCGERRARAQIARRDSDGARLPQALNCRLEEHSDL